MTRPSIETSDAKREMLRHTLATLAYRGGKALRGAPEDFGARRFAETSRTPVEILAHIGDLLEWACWLAEGQHKWSDDAPKSWAEEVRRFYEGVAKLDTRLASGRPLGCEPEKLFQGPIADALTHVGQINMLRRMAGSPVRGENYFRAEIARGHVGDGQSDRRVEFD